jgi:hypothetical protein
MSRKVRCQIRCGRWSSTTALRSSSERTQVCDSHRPVQRLLRLARDALATVADAERDLARLKGNAGGQLRIVLECHHLF